MMINIKKALESKRNKENNEKWKLEFLAPWDSAEKDFKVPDEIKPYEIISEDNSDSLGFKMQSKYNWLSFASRPWNMN